MIDEGRCDSDFALEAKIISEADDKAKGARIAACAAVVCQEFQLPTACWSAVITKRT